MIAYPNQKGVAIERVTYRARNIGTTIVANLFKPAGFDATRKYAAVVVTHPFGGVREQTSGLYAQRLAEQGLITLAYDASYQGESGGEPRLMEVPAQRLDDISCAIDFLTQHPQVDPERIGSLGICAGGGYALCHAQNEQLDTISPRPLLVIAGSRADFLFWSQQVHEKAKEPKELFVVNGATHIDLYDRPLFVTPAVEKLTAFFNHNLSAAGATR